MTSILKNRRIGWWIAAIILIVLMMSTKTMINLVTDWLWYKEIGLSGVFIKTLATKIICSLSAGMLGGIILFINMTIAMRISKSPFMAPSYSIMQFAQTYAVGPLLKLAIPAVSLFFAFVMGGYGGSLWNYYLKFKGYVPFNSVDPLFGKNIGFYVFTLPFLQNMYYSAVAVFAVSLAAVLMIYILRAHCTVSPKISMSQGAKAHVLLILGILVCSGYLFYQFKMYGMITSGSHIVNGAGYSDIHYYIPVLKLMRYVCIIAGIFILLNMYMKTLRLAIIGIIFIAAGDLGGKGASQIMQKFVVAPNEVDKETPYINWSIKNTRAAYNLENIDTKDFSPSDNLSGEIMENNNLTIKNIRLWDQAPLLTTFSQLQEIRTYYQFLDVDNDRYQIGGETRQVMLSPRELFPANLPSRIWINEHLSYTHGYGLCMGPVNSVTSEGLPNFFIKNIPPESNTQVKVSRPEIYFGESPAGYAIVNTKAKEFDYPAGNDNVYTSYEGKGGIVIGGFAKKTLFAMAFNEIKILLSSDITSQSRILFNRNIIERVNKAIPFLTYDQDPYMVVTKEGRLVWMLDGYTVTDAYPYSAGVSGIGNYIRNSVKITVDAYDGILRFYIADPYDPIINSYSKIFPGVFRTFSEMPDDLRSHIRYPQTLFTVQARVYSLYHMTDPQIFYNKEDLWKIPETFSEGSMSTMMPYYTIMKLAEVGKKEEFILMVPLTPAKKENMIAWLAARCDEPDYGKMLVFNFPKQNLIYGPSQIESRINQDPEISKTLTLWNQGGSRVVWGSLLVIPIDKSLIYVQPLYLAAQSGGVPELKRVIVAYGNSIVMEPTLEASLNAIFGKSIIPIDNGNNMELSTKNESPSNNLKTLISEANEQFEYAQAEIRRGNWNGYGEAMKKVEQILKEMGNVTIK
jgi:uncharacterized protein